MGQEQDQSEHPVCSGSASAQTGAGTTPRFLFVMATILAAYLALTLTRAPFDFWVYYHSALALRLGINPYDMQAVSTALHPDVPVKLPFIYGPWSFALFLPFSFFPFKLASFLYGLVLAWAVWGIIVESLRLVPIGAIDGPVALLVSVAALLSWGNPLLIIFASQNPAPIEAFLVLSGLRMIVDHRTRAGLTRFFFPIALKMQPAGLLAIALYRENKSLLRSALLIVLSVSLLAIPLLLVCPDLTSDWLQILRSTPWMDDPAFSPLYLLTKVGLPVGISAAIHLVIGGAAFVTCLRAFRKRQLDGYEIACCIVTFMLLQPRLKDYTLILSVPVTFALVNVAGLRVLGLTLLPTIVVGLWPKNPWAQMTVPFCLSIAFCILLRLVIQQSLVPRHDMRTDAGSADSILPGTNHHCHR